MTQEDASAEKSPVTPPSSNAELSELDLEQVAGGAQYNPKELQVNNVIQKVDQIIQKVVPKGG